MLQSFVRLALVLALCFSLPSQAAWPKIRFSCRTFLMATAVFAGTSMYFRNDVKNYLAHWEIEGLKTRMEKSPAQFSFTKEDYERAALEFVWSKAESNTSNVLLGGKMNSSYDYKLRNITELYLLLASEDKATAGKISAKMQQMKVPGELSLTAEENSSEFSDFVNHYEQVHSDATVHFLTKLDQQKQIASLVSIALESFSERNPPTAEALKNGLTMTEFLAPLSAESSQLVSNYRLRNPSAASVARSFQTSPSGTIFGGGGGPSRFGRRLGRSGGSLPNYQQSSPKYTQGGSSTAAYQPNPAVDLNYINTKRAQAGIPVLVYSPELSVQAENAAAAQGFTAPSIQAPFSYGWNSSSGAKVHWLTADRDPSQFPNDLWQTAGRFRLDRSTGDWNSSGVTTIGYYYRNGTLWFVVQ